MIIFHTLYSKNMYIGLIVFVPYLIQILYQFWYMFASQVQPKYQSSYRIYIMQHSTFCQMIISLMKLIFTRVVLNRLYLSRITSLKRDIFKIWQLSNLQKQQHNKTSLPTGLSSYKVNVRHQAELISNY